MVSPRGGGSSHQPDGPYGRANPQPFVSQPAGTGSVDRGRPRRCPQPIWLQPKISYPDLPRVSHVGPNGLTYALDADPILLGAPIATNCKRWLCSACGPRRRAEVLKHIRAGFHADEPLRFLTFTYPWHTAHKSTREGVAAANREFRYFVQEFRRRGFVIEYAKVIEFTKRGRVHLHALTRGSLIPKCTDRGRRKHGLPTGTGSGSPCYCTAAKPCLQSLAWSAGFGFVEIRYVKNPEQAAAYIAKYLAKSCADTQWPKYARRYTTSRRWAKITLAGIHRQWVEQLRAQYGHRMRDVCTPPAEVIAWQLIPPPHNREHVIWRHGPPVRNLTMHYPDHLDGRLWNPDTGEVFDLPPVTHPNWRTH